MERERWENLVRLHSAALEQEESQRSGFLREACAGDEDLRREVESLLAYEKKGEGFMETPALEAAAKELAGEKMALAPGTHLGPYEIQAPIGAGGMGEVYRAHDPRLKRDVAIKVLPAGMAMDRAHIARFEREARAASALSHPNIVAVYDLGLEGQTYWIATELVVGEPLKTLIERGPLPARRTIEIATQIAGGLAAAHAAGVVHRDLKPGNIMVTREGRIKILDFGLAKRRTEGDGVPEDLTHTGAVMGTAAYMSPEQVRGEPVDHRSDIFCLGLILHEMLSGKRTFTGESSVHIMHAILTEDAPELPAGVPAGLARIVAHCLEKEASARFQSAADIGFDLGSMAGAERTATGSALPGSHPVKKDKTAARLLAGALVVVTLLLAALAFVYFRQKPGAQPTVRLSVLLPEKSRAVSLAVSPDGREIAMVLVKEGRQQIWVRPLDVLGPTALAGTDGALDPFWSPDSRYIGFFADAKLKTIEHSGGPVQTLCDALGTYGGRLEPERRNPARRVDARADDPGRRRNACGPAGSCHGDRHVSNFPARRATLLGVARPFWFAGSRRLGRSHQRTGHTANPAGSGEGRYRRTASRRHRGIRAVYAQQYPDGAAARYEAAGTGRRSGAHRAVDRDKLPFARVGRGFAGGSAGVCVRPPERTPIYVA